MMETLALSNRYALEARLESRPEGVVYRARDRQASDTLCRLTVAAAPESQKLLRHAYRLHERLHHPGQPKVLSFETLSDGTCLQVQEWHEGHGELLALATPFIGRRKELALLTEAALEARSECSVRTVTVHGEAGCGKSRLMDELRARLSQLDFEMLSVRGGDRQVGAPLHAWRHAIRSLIPRLPSEKLAALAPALGSFLSDLAEEPAQPLEPKAERARLFRAIATLIEAAVRENPLALFLDDWHLADSASRELVDYLVRTFSEHPLCLIIATQAPASSEDGLQLGPLGGKEMRALYRELAGEKSLSNALLNQLDELTGGNPALLEEVMRELTLDGNALTQLMAPPFVQAAIEPARAVAALRIRRLAGCSRASQTLALAASVCGVRASATLLQRVAGLDEENFLSALDELLESTFLVLEQDGYTLRAVEVAFDDLGERPAMHARALAYWQVAAQMGASVPTATLAAHAAAAQDPSSSAFYALQAARDALGLYALDEAEPLLKQAQAALEGLEGAPEDWKLDYAVSHGDYLRYRGVALEAEDYYQQALSLAAKYAPERQSEINTGLGITLGMKSRLDEAEAAFCKAVLLAGSDGQARARALTNLCRLHVRLGRSEEAARLAWETLEIDDVSDRYRGEALGLLGLIHATSQTPLAIDGIAYLAEAQALAEASGDRLALNNTCMLAGNAWMALGHLPEARTSFQRNALLSQELGLKDESACAALNMAQVAYEEGRFLESHRMARLGLGAALEDGNAIYEAHGHLYAGLASCQLGYLSEAEEELSLGLAIAQDLHNEHLYLQALSAHFEANLFLGRLGRAEELGLEMARKEKATGIREFAGRHALLMGRLYELSDEFESAVRHLNEGLRLAKECGNIALSAEALFGMAANAKRAGQWALAQSRAEEALPLAERAGSLLLQLRLHLLLTRLCWSLENHEQSNIHLAAAKALCQEIGSPHWLALMWQVQAHAEPEAADLPLKAATFLRFYLNQLPPRARQEFQNWPERRALLGSARHTGPLSEGGPQ